MGCLQIKAQKKNSQYIIKNFFKYLTNRELSVISNEKVKNTKKQTYLNL